MVVLARTLLQGRTKEGGDVHRHRSIPLIAMDHPALLTLDPLLPRSQQVAYLPLSPSQRAPRPANGLLPQPVRCNAPNTAPRSGSSAPLTSIHSRCSIPKFVPTGRAFVTAINASMV